MIGARSLAYQVLLHMEKQAVHPDRLIASVLERHSRLDERDRALMTELIYGVLRWRERLDRQIDGLCKSDPKRVAPEVRILLRLALYQIIFLDRVPNHAAVNEAVNMAKGIPSRHVSGFVNALLREALRQGDDWKKPSQASDPEAYLSVMASHPRWFVKLFMKELGYDETEQLCRANNAVAPMTLRVNGLKATMEQALARLAEEGVEAEPSPCLPASAVRVTGIRRDVARLDTYRDGWLQVQDEASQAVSIALGPRPGDRVLDLCAGFGGKSTHLGALMGNDGEILAVDQSGWKLAELEENAARQGIGIIRTETSDALKLSPESTGEFDRVLLDAPCSGFGALRRNPDIKWRRSIKDPYRFSRIQKELLAHAARFVKKGGSLLYATCTLFRDENENVATEFDTDHPGFEPVPANEFLPEELKGMTSGPYFRSWPHRDGIDGFFAAVWRRVE